MKLLSVASSLRHGGAETVLVDLVLGLQEHEHRVAHASVTRGRIPHPPFLQRLARAGAECHDVTLDALGDARERHRILGDFEPDVVLFHWWGRDSLRPWVDTTRAAGRARPAFVCVLHHSGIPAPSGYDHYVAVTRTQIEQVPLQHDHLVRVIPNGVDLDRFCEATRLARQNGDRMVVGRVSRLTDDKIPADWVRTAASYELPDTRFVIAGDGPLLASLRDDVDGLGLNDHFELPGYVAREHIPELLRGFDVFCHVTSTAVECHPLALLESLAAGVPIVAEARGGIPEVVEHGVNGMVASSLQEIGEHLHALRRNEELRQQLSAGARRTAPKFSLQRQLDAYRCLLAEIEHDRRAAAT